MDKQERCLWCNWYMACYNSDERYREEHYGEEVTTVCEDYITE